MNVKNQSAIILGIDPGYAITGYGVIAAHQGQLTPLGYGVIRTASALPIEQRLRVIYDRLQALIEEFDPTVMAVEELFFARNVTTGISTAQARGLALLAAAQVDIPVYEYTPMQVKLAVTGYGRAEKTQVQAMVQRLLNLDHCPKPDDAADALAVALCQAQTAPQQIQSYRAVSGYNDRESLAQRKRNRYQ